MTLNATTAQKQNLGQTRIRGVQTDVEYRIGSFWRVTGALRLRPGQGHRRRRRERGARREHACRRCRCTGDAFRSRTRTRATPRSPFAMQALSLRQLTTIRTSSSSRRPRWPKPATPRSPDPGCRATHRSISRSCATCGRNVQVFYGMQNMFDQVSFVQTNPSTTGTPRLMNVGVRVQAFRTR